VGTYVTPIAGTDLYEPSTDIRIVGKLSVSQDEYVFSRVELVSDNSNITVSKQNIDQP